MISFSKSTILGITFGILLVGYAVFAFTPPTLAPPGDNVPAPINIGPLEQTKTGNLLINSLGTVGNLTAGADLSVFGDINLTGTLQTGSVPWGRLTSVPAGFADGIDNTGITSESDPQVGAVTSGRWCRGTGSQVQCDQSPPSGGHVSEGLYGSCRTFRRSTGGNISGCSALSSPSICITCPGWTGPQWCGRCSCLSGYVLIRTGWLDSSSPHTDPTFTCLKQ